MAEENISQEFRLKNTEKSKNYFINEIEQNELMSNVQHNTCRTLNYNDYFFI